MSAFRRSVLPVQFEPARDLFHRVELGAPVLIF